MEVTDSRKEPESLPEALKAIQALERKNSELVAESRKRRVQREAWRTIAEDLARHPIVRLLLGRRVRRLLRENGVNLTIEY